MIDEDIFSGSVDPAHVPVYSERFVEYLKSRIRDLEHELSQVTAERDALQKAVVDWDNEMQARKRY